MNIKDIKALAAVLTQADLSVLDYAEGDMHIRLERIAAKVAVVAQADCAPAAAPAGEEKNDFNNLCEVKAPMVGVFYAAPSPDAKPYVKVGDMVEKGQVLCLIEAMYPNFAASPIDLTQFPRLKGVLDVVYNPLRTRLLQQAEALQIPCAGGLTMLVWQAVRARELFDGHAGGGRGTRADEQRGRAEPADHTDRRTRCRGSCVQFHYLRCKQRYRKSHQHCPRDGHPVWHGSPYQ